MLSNLNLGQKTAISTGGGALFGVGLSILPTFLMKSRTGNATADALIATFGTIGVMAGATILTDHLLKRPPESIEGVMSGHMLGAGTGIGVGWLLTKKTLPMMVGGLIGGALAGAVIEYFQLPTKWWPK